MAISEKRQSLRNVHVEKSCLSELQLRNKSQQQQKRSSIVGDSTSNTNTDRNNAKESMLEQSKDHSLSSPIPAASSSVTAAINVISAYAQTTQPRSASLITPITLPLPVRR